MNLCGYSRSTLPTDRLKNCEKVCTRKTNSMMTRGVAQLLYAYQGAMHSPPSGVVSLAHWWQNQKPENQQEGG